MDPSETTPLLKEIRTQSDELPLLSVQESIDEEVDGLNIQRVESKQVESQLKPPLLGVKRRKTMPVWKPESHSSRTPSASMKNLVDVVSNKSNKNKEGSTRVKAKSRSRTPTTVLSKFLGNLTGMIPEKDHHTDFAGVGGIWAAMRHGDMDTVWEILATNPEVLDTTHHGVTPFFVCLIYEHWDMAEELLDKYPHIVDYRVPSGIREGETCLHLLILKHRESLAMRVMKMNPDLVFERAIGEYFDVQKPCGFGEWPLFFAACMGERDLFEACLSRGADIFATDDDGNSILHILVYKNKSEMFKYVVHSMDEIGAESIGEDAWYALRHDIHAQVNDNGLSPLELSVKLGCLKMFGVIVSSGIIQEWKYDDIQCNLYPLDGIDSVQKEADESTYHEGSHEVCRFKAKKYVVRTACDANPIASALQAMVKFDKPEFLNIPLIRSIIEAEWHRLVKWHFYRKLLATAAFLALFTTSISVHKHYPSSIWDIALWSLTFLVIIVKTAQELQQLVLFGLGDYFGSNLANTYENVMSLGFCLLMIAATIDRLMNPSFMGTSCTSLAALMGWLYSLFFFLGFQLTGPFVIMIFRMLASDVARFLLLYILLLFTWVTAAYYIEHDVSYLTMLTYFIRLTFADFPDQPMSDSVSHRGYEGVYWPLKQLYVGSWMVISAVLLMNILIAMMSTTYNTVITDATLTWYLMRLRISIAMHQEHEGEEVKHEWWIQKNGRRYLVSEEANMAETLGDASPEKTHPAGHPYLCEIVHTPRWGPTSSNSSIIQSPRKDFKL